MRGAGTAFDDVEQKLVSADRVRMHAPAVVDRAVARLADLAPQFRSIPFDDLAGVVEGYLEALAAAIETNAPEALIAFFDESGGWWQANGVQVDQVIRGLCVIDDEIRSQLNTDDVAGSHDIVEFWTREAVALFARQTLTSVADRLGGEIERHRSAEERLLSLQRVSAAVVGDLDLDRTLQVIVEEARHLMGAAAAVIRLVDEDSQTLKVVTKAGLDDTLLLGSALPVEGSLSGYSFRFGLPVISNKVEEDKRLDPEIREATSVRSLLIVPLIVRDRPIGVLLVGGREHGAFTEEDKTLLTLFADQAASAIENGRLYQQAQQQIAELAILQRISSVISSSLDLDAVFRAIYEEIRGVMPADAFWIALARQDGGFDLEFIMDDGQRFSPLRHFEFSPVFWSAIRERRPIVIGDVFGAGVPRMHTIGHPQTRVRSIIAAPLMKGAEIVGLISAQSYVPYHYRESDARLLMTIANHAVVAIDHARLYQQAQSLAIVEERNRLAREIHDTLAQGLIGIILYLERLDLTVPPDDTRLRPLVERALALARGNLEEARRSVRDLRAAPLEGRTLAEALQHLAEELRRDGAFTVRLTLTENLPLLAARVETALFRMVQEATANCRKHAQCSEVHITLAVEDGTLRLEVTDDGLGFDAATAMVEPHRFGLSTMRERISQVGGEFTIVSQPGDGTTVRAEIPLCLAMHSESEPDC